MKTKVRFSHLIAAAMLVASSFAFATDVGHGGGTTQNDYKQQSRQGGSSEVDLNIFFTTTATNPDELDPSVLYATNPETFTVERSWMDGETGGSCVQARLASQTPPAIASSYLRAPAMWTSVMDQNGDWMTGCGCEPGFARRPMAQGYSYSQWDTLFFTCVYNAGQLPTGFTNSLTLAGNTTYTIANCGSFTEPGYSAMDANNGNVTSSVVVTNAGFNRCTAGNHTITYTINYSSGGSSSKSRVITVQAPPPPPPPPGGKPPIWTADTYGSRYLTNTTGCVAIDIWANGVVTFDKDDTGAVDGRWMEVGEDPANYRIRLDGHEGQAGSVSPSAAYPSFPGDIKWVSGDTGITWEECYAGGGQGSNGQYDVIIEEINTGDTITVTVELSAEGEGA